MNKRYFSFLLKNILIFLMFFKRFVHFEHYQEKKNLF